jgi:lipopolysaccharide/colanic/teichoic acid biosynthesis glycosyltransferase
MFPLQKTIKRLFDLLVSFIGMLLLWPLGILLVVVIKVTSKGPVIYSQKRIGRFGESFLCYKFRTMYTGSDRFGSVTTGTDKRVTPVGRILRRFKLDELPQLWNVMIGRMSFVGPRPDVPGYADLLHGEDRLILELRPGITGPASLCFRNEEEILAKVDNPVKYNDEVIWPAKVKINADYYRKWSFWKDIGYILVTVLPVADGILKLIPAENKQKGQEFSPWA